MKFQYIMVTMFVISGLSLQETLAIISREPEYGSGLLGQWQQRSAEAKNMSKGKETAAHRAILMQELEDLVLKSWDKLSGQERHALIQFALIPSSVSAGTFTDIAQTLQYAFDKKFGVQNWPAANAPLEEKQAFDRAHRKMWGATSFVESEAISNPFPKEMNVETRPMKIEEPNESSEIEKQKATVERVYPGTLIHIDQLKSKAVAHALQQGQNANDYRSYVNMMVDQIFLDGDNPQTIRADIITFLGNEINK